MKLPRVYKFLHTKYLDGMLAGNIRISRDSHFRAIEQKEGAWIGDRLENTSEAQFNGSFTAEALEAATPPGRKPLVAAAPGTPVTFKNVAVGYGGSDFYMYSVCRGDLRRLTKVMCDAAPYDRRDACVEIFNFPKIAKILLRWGRTAVNGKILRMVDLFSSVEQDRVIYRAMTVEGGKPMAEPSPFNKDLVFRSQSEVRVVFEPRDLTIPEVLDVEIDRPHRFFREVFRDRSLTG